MASFAEISSLYESGNLKSRLRAAIAKQALDIYAEDVGTTNHANRVIWAKDALANVDTKVSQMMWHIVQNATIQNSGEAATDNDILYVVGQTVNTYATGS